MEGRPINYRHYLAYAIALCFIFRGIFGLGQTLISEHEFSRMVIETYLFQSFHIIAGVLLLMKKKIAIYFFAAIFISHIFGRLWFFSGSEDVFNSMVILYLAGLITLYSGLSLYLYRLREWGYYATSKSV